MTPALTGTSPFGIAAGPDGNLWFSENGDYVARMTPAGSVLGEFVIPGPRYLTGGSDGNMWVSLGSLPPEIGRATISGTTTGYAADPMASPRGVAAGPDGYVWFAEGGNTDKIGRIDPGNTGAGVTGFPGLSSRADFIAAGTDGNLWFTETSGNRIGRITPGGVITEFTTGLSSGAQPGGITAGPDGRMWFTETGKNQIGRIDPANTAAGVTEFPGLARPADTSIVAGPDGNLWFTESSGNKVGRITPSGSVNEFPAGFSFGANPDTITAGPDGNLWFTESAQNRVGKINTEQDPPAFRNAASISIPASGTTGPAGPYPSSINVSGLQDVITDVDVRLFGLSHTFPRDVDFLLVGPQGQTALIVSDVQGSAPEPNGISWTVDDEGPSQFPTTNVPLVSGIFQPRNVDDGGNDAFPAPAPAGPYGSSLSVFDGTSPNGTWQLFVRDDANGDIGALYGGWGLDIKTAPVAGGGGGDAGGGGGGAGGGGDAGGGGGAGDTSVALTLQAAKKQKLKKLAVDAGCGAESCTLDVGGSVKAKPKKRRHQALKGNTFNLAPATAASAAGATAPIHLTVAGKKPAKRLKKLLARKAKATATIAVTATDAAGNTATGSVSVRLKK